MCSGRAVCPGHGTVPCPGGSQGLAAQWPEGPSKQLTGLKVADKALSWSKHCSPSRAPTYGEGSGKAQGSCLAVSCVPPEPLLGAAGMLQALRRLQQSGLGCLRLAAAQGCWLCSRVPQHLGSAQLTSCELLSDCRSHTRTRDIHILLEAADLGHIVSAVLAPHAAQSCSQLHGTARQGRCMLVALEAPADPIRLHATPLGAKDLGPLFPQEHGILSPMRCC